ncbi:MAG: AbrB/MazE/SpoVT family DNA-binding domain-containing protein [Selenomonadaceae bacterium]|nr:AbrB/MazE/SpoVT family DNA-binding domain-containing protein [Selenomonadaceae bacterium]
MLTAKVFQSGNSQAIRIPKEMQTQEKEFIIKKYGNCLFLLPIDDPWALLKQSLGQIDEKEVLFERDQPMLMDIPEREAL